MVGSLAAHEKSTYEEGGGEGEKGGGKWEVCPAIARARGVDTLKHTHSSIWRCNLSLLHMVMGAYTLHQAFTAVYL